MRHTPHDTIRTEYLHTSTLLRHNDKNLSYPGIALWPESHRLSKKPATTEGRFPLDRKHVSSVSVNYCWNVMKWFLGFGCYRGEGI